MAINLNKNKDQLISAWKDVLNDKTQTNWAIFGYEGQTNDLKVVSHGCGGIEEMSEDLNIGKIMYAFLRVQDPKTTLYKFVLINWQGEGANIIRKGTCANHVRDVANFFTGAHVTVDARSEDEVEPQLIIDKVSRSTGSVYSFKKRSQNEVTANEELKKPIGTNYQKVNPNKEINSQERNNFWLKEEQEEKRRVEEERKKLEQARLKLETEVKNRELNNAKQREESDKIVQAKLTEVRKAEKMALELERLRSENKEDSYADDKDNINKSELLRKQRKEEAQQLIGKSTSQARSIFEQNTAAGQLSTHAPAKPIRNSLLNKKVSSVSKTNGNLTNNTNGNSNEPIKNSSNVLNHLAANDDSNQESESDLDDQFSTIKRCPKVVNDSDSLKMLNEVNQLISQDEFIDSDKKEVIRVLTEQQIVDEVVYQDFDGDLGLKARALYDYQAADDTEITFDPGDIITHIDQIDEGWWQGLGPDGTYGLFPANYVELINTN